LYYRLLDIYLVKSDEHRDHFSNLRWGL
jgi:hypothetical protein